MRRPLALRIWGDISRQRSLVFAFSSLLIAVPLGIASLPRTASVLVLNHPRRADAIVVATGDVYRDDLYYRNALHLLHSNYGRHLLLPADASGQHPDTEADEAENFIETTAGTQRESVSVCPENNDEYGSVDKCLGVLHAHTVLLVTPAVESRRLLMLYERHLPEYSWYVAAVPDPSVFGDRWWSNRQWAKAYVENVQRLIYSAARQ